MASNKKIIDDMKKKFGLISTQGLTKNYDKWIQYSNGATYFADYGSQDCLLFQTIHSTFRIPIRDTEKPQHENPKDCVS